MRSRRVLRRGIGRLLIIVLLLYPFFLYLQGVYNIMHLNSEIREVRAEIQIWKEKNRELQEEVERLESARYVEEVAREKLGLVKPGETLFILVEPAQPTDS